MNYREFLRRKTQQNVYAGFDPLWVPDCMFEFQRILTEWSIRKGRSVLIEDCGLGKTLQELVFAENCVRKTNRPALILTPLAVAAQTQREAEKFGIEAVVSRDGTPGKNITITNYESLHKFDSKDFECVVADEISCLKAFDGKRRKFVTRFMSKTPYRLGGTATAAPNDYIELGTISEAIGELTQSEMLGMFFLSSDKKRHSLFKEGDFWNRAKYFFRAHAEKAFWQWVCFWARAIRTPADMGIQDDRFILPELHEHLHVIPTTFRFPGELFVRVAATLQEQRVERKRSLKQRCEKVVELTAHNEPVIVWCQYNDEGDLLEKMIPGAVQVAGCNSDEEKAERLNGFATGQFRVLVTKPKIGAWGMNYQHCGHQTFFPSHSFEQVYQCIRRSLRFGRVGPVRCDIVATEGEAGVMANLQKKQRKADEMFTALVAEMHSALRVESPDRHVKEAELPKWLLSSKS
ncbi:MAG: hypothetical protein E6Q97_09755 [Desulfurellales bacterium]|nr:MAG: hypothetical protein E6Q97_09755 [Desulfurellales bacterium]